LLADLCIAGFEPLDPSAYELAERWAQEAERGGYPRIE
jgi:hypothetical protein